MDEIESYEGEIADLDDTIVSLMVDKMICDKIFLEAGIIARQKFFRLCFLKGLNEVLLHILGLGSVGIWFRSIFDGTIIGAETLPPFLMQNFEASEDVVIKVLHLLRLVQLSSTQLSRMVSHVNPETNENLLHWLLQKNMNNALVNLMEIYLSCSDALPDLNKLFFKKNLADDFPINIAINQTSFRNDPEINLQLPDNIIKSFKNMAHVFWFMMLRTDQIDEISNVVTSIGVKGKQSGQNLLHSCVNGKENELFVAICLEPKIDRYTLVTALNHPNNNGLMPLYICDDEDAVLQIMEKFDNLKLDHETKKGNSLLHVLAKRNFIRCIKKMFRAVQDEEKILNMISKQNKHGNNPLMSCIFKNSGDALNLLLCNLFSLDFDRQDGKVLKDILHERNKTGETLLGLVLEYQQTMRLPENLVLELERICHKKGQEKIETVTELTLCLKNHEEASSEAFNAIKEVENSYEKTNYERIPIWIQLFLSSFLVPFGVMVSDMSFDIILLVGYAAYLLLRDDSINPATMEAVCPGSNPNNSVIILRSYLNDVEHLLRLENDIPNHLSGRPRFFYSLFFIVLPWVFYAIEFCHSRHLSTTTKQVCFNIILV